MAATQRLGSLRAGATYLSSTLFLFMTIKVHNSASRNSIEQIVSYIQNGRPEEATNKLAYCWGTGAAFYAIAAWEKLGEKGRELFLAALKEKCDPLPKVPAVESAETA
jgi:hypothetical protein